MDVIIQMAKESSLWRAEAENQRDSVLESLVFALLPQPSAGAEDQNQLPFPQDSEVHLGCIDSSSVNNCESDFFFSRGKENKKIKSGTS